MPLPSYPYPHSAPTLDVPAPQIGQLGLQLQHLNQQAPLVQAQTEHLGAQTQQLEQVRQDRQAIAQKFGMPVEAVDAALKTAEEISRTGNHEAAAKFISQVFKIQVGYDPASDAHLLHNADRTVTSIDRAGNAKLLGGEFATKKEDTSRTLYEDLTSDDPKVKAKAIAAQQQMATAKTPGLAEQTDADILQAYADENKLDVSKMTAGQKQLARAENKRAMDVSAGGDPWYKTFEQPPPLGKGRKPTLAEISAHQNERSTAGIRLQLGSGSLGADAAEIAAEYYLKTGTLPSGMGAAGTAMKKQIMNRAGEMAKERGTNLAENVAGYGADKASLTNMQKSRDSITSFESTALKNADLMMGLANKLTDTGSPWLNKPVRTYQAEATGDTNIKSFEAARRVFANEVAKITSNPNMAGVLTNEARQEIDKILSGNATIPQIADIVKTLKIDMENRRTSMDSTIKEIQGRIAVSKSEAGDTEAGGYGPVENKTLKSGQTVRVRKNLSTGKYEDAP